MDEWSNPTAKKRGRGKRFSVYEDRQICRSWVYAKEQAELGDDNPTNAIRSVPFNTWDTLYEHAVSKDPTFLNRSVIGLRTRFLAMQFSVRKFAECYSKVSLNENDPGKVLDGAMECYKEENNEDFKYLSCYPILRQSPKFQDMPEIDMANISEELAVVSAAVLTDEENVSKRKPKMPKATKVTNKEDASKSGQKLRIRGKNFSGEDDTQIYLSYIYAREEKESSHNTYRLTPFNLWETVRQHASFKNPDFEHRTVKTLRFRFMKTQRAVRNFYRIYTEAMQHEADPETALMEAMQRYEENFNEGFKYQECFQIFLKSPELQQLAEKYSSVNTVTFNAAETTMDCNDKETSDMSETEDCKPKVECFPEDTIIEQSIITEEGRKPNLETQKTPESERKAHGHRGKTYTSYHDKLLCLSWIDAKEAEASYTATSEMPFNFWDNVFEHAVAKDPSFKVRPITSVRHRLLLVTRSIRKFAEYYKKYAPEEADATDQKAVQKSLQLYAENYNEKFKFLGCWSILRKSCKFRELLENSPIAKPVPGEEKNTDGEKGGGLNVRQDEIQALLRASLDVGVEETRSRGKQMESLIYGVQQRMTTYGDFDERKLDMLKQIYDKTETQYKTGQLKPYPPEARILWGRRGPSKDDKKNDEDWDQLVQHVLDYKKGSSYLSDLEIKELLNQAIKSKLESISPIEQMVAFIRIVKDMQSKSLCRRKNADQLQQDYRRLKTQFLDGSRKNLPPEAVRLWDPTAVDEDEEQDTPEPIAQIDFAEVNMKVELDCCRICQAELLEEQSKDLFYDVYNEKTYADIITENINVKMTKDGSQGNLICDNCSTFIESLAKFVEQCRNSCASMQPNGENSMIVDVTKHESEVFDTNVEFLDEEASNLLEDDFHGFDESLLANDDTMNAKNEENFAGLTFAQSVSTVERPDENLETEFDEKINSVTNDDTMDVDNEVGPAEPAIGETTPTDARSSEENLEVAIRKRLNYRKYVDSRKRKSMRGVKKQCHLCGKTVRELADHIESHGATGFKCEYCDRVCPNRRQLKVHMNIHTKQHKFPCRYCDKIFYVWASRQGHERTVHHNLTFKCDLCDAVYKHKAYLVHHKKTVHLGIRNWKCTACDFCATLKVRLLNHFRSLHTSARPYKCSVCGFLSNSNTGYYIHYQRHKKANEVTSYSIKCAYCDETFTKDAAFEVHIVKAHPDLAVNV